ncbi:MAG: anthranilate synthase component 1 [Chloroflexi bacterium]|jgi:anthranilate synthase component 1|nr:MAG: anthranilate synthase component 1 [Chloroflexota bacterium]
MIYNPTLDEVKLIFRENKWNMVPLYRDINIDLETPVTAFLKVATGPYSFLLESAEGGERQARYSFIGTEPYDILKTGPRTELGAIDPLIPLQEKLSRYKSLAARDLPRFLGGAIGYLSYETFRYYEPRVTSPEADPLGVPESVLMFTDTMLVFDHVKHVIKLVSHVHLQDNVEMAYREAADRIETMARRLETDVMVSKESCIANYTQAEVSNFSKNEYIDVVNRCKQYIIAGDIIQVVPSRRIARNTYADPFSIYQALRVLNPSPYMYFLKMDDFYIIGASPETLVRVEEGFVYNYPLAGTVRRGVDPEEDARLEEKLRNDEKEMAEHIMLVDLGRNDVGKVSESGSVKVNDLARVVKYSHVMHLESEIEGKLRSDKTIFDALRSCMPAGTLSGAPKIRAMEIIAEVEHEKRGPYGAAVGYFGFQGNMDTAIPIRTIVMKNGVAYLQAGGGIVYDSDPESEWQETVNKMAAPARAIVVAEESQFSK